MEATRSSRAWLAACAGALAIAACGGSDDDMGYAATILDSVLGCAVHTTLEPGTGYTTLSLEVKMVRPVTAEIERVRAEGEVLYRGRRQATAQAQLTDAATGKLLAHGTATCLIL